MLYFKILYFKKVNRPLYSGCMKQLFLTLGVLKRILLHVTMSLNWICLCPHILEEFHMSDDTGQSTCLVEMKSYLMGTLSQEILILLTSVWSSGCALQVGETTKDLFPPPSSFLPLQAAPSLACLSPPLAALQCPVFLQAWNALVSQIHNQLPFSLSKTLQNIIILRSVSVTWVQNLGLTIGLHQCASQNATSAGGHGVAPNLSCILRTWDIHPRSSYILCTLWQAEQCQSWDVTSGDCLESWPHH